MATVFDDTFSGVSVVTIDSRAPDTGIGWTQHPSIAGTTISDLGTGFAMFNATGAAAKSAYQTEVLPNADASITATFKRDTGNGGAVIGLSLRCNLSDFACYRALYTTVDGKYHIYRIGGGGVATEIAGTGTAFMAWTVGGGHTMTFSVVGSNLELLVDAVSVLTATDTTFTSAGRAGLYNEKSGATAFDFSINQFSVDANTSAFNPAILLSSFNGGFSTF
jgi:hypothetical protein